MEKFQLGIDQIRKYLPHRYPFLMVDRILDIQLSGPLSDMSGANMAGIKVTAIKNITNNEPIFTGHFPNFSIFPGVLQIEAMAQAASFSIYPFIEKDLEEFVKVFQCILVGVDEARFRRPVVPGDTLRLETTVTKARGKIWTFDCQAFVEDQRAAEVKLIANMNPHLEEWSKR